MTDHSGLLDRYRRMREVRFRLNNLLVKTIPKKTLEECGRILGFFRKGVLFFESEDETSVLMDYCLYYPRPDGRNLVAKYLEKSPPPAGSDEMVALQEMTHAYYSLFQVIGVERGVGVGVRDLLRGETGFIVDVGFGDTAQRHMIAGDPDHPGGGLPHDRGSGPARRCVGGGTDLQGVEADRLRPRDLRLQADHTPAGSRSRRHHHPGMPVRRGCPPASPMRSPEVEPAPLPSAPRSGASVATTLARAGAGRSSRRAAVEGRA